MPSQHTIGRRGFLQLGALGATGLSHLFSSRQVRANTSAPSEKITVGMIAVGARAHQLMETIQQIPDVEIVAVCDAYRGRVARAISRTGGRAREIGDYRDLLQDPGIDSVVISSPDHWHAQQAVEAMDAGKHIYIEKPLTYTPDEGLTIMAAQQRNQVVVQVGSTGISGSLAQQAREMVRSGRLGQVTMLRAATNRNTSSGAWVYPIPPDASPETVDWDLFQGSAPKHPFDLKRFFRWRCYRDYSGGMSTDLFVHTCTLIHYVMDASMCESAIGMGGLYRWTQSRDVPDTINASLKYPEGFLVSLSGTFNSQLRGRRGLQILGTEGSLVLGRELTFTPETARPNNGWIVDSWPEALEEAYWRDPQVRAAERPAAPATAAEPEVSRSDGKSSVRAHFEEFFQAVRTGGKTVEDATVGHYAAACAHLVNLSIDRGEVVHWDATKKTVRAA